MAAISATVAHHRARVARLTQSYAPDAPELANARVDLAISKINDFVTKVVSELPPLTDEQKDTIAALLRAGA